MAVERRKKLAPAAKRPSWRWARGLVRDWKKDSGGAGGSGDGDFEAGEEEVEGSAIVKDGCAYAISMRCLSQAFTQDI